MQSSNLPSPSHPTGQYVLNINFFIETVKKWLNSIYSIQNKINYIHSKKILIVFKKGRNSQVYQLSQAFIEEYWVDIHLNVVLALFSYCIYTIYCIACYSSQRVYQIWQTYKKLPLLPLLAHVTLELVLDSYKHCPLIRFRCHKWDSWYSAPWPQPWNFTCWVQLHNDLLVFRTTYHGIWDGNRSVTKTLSW